MAATVSVKECENTRENKTVSEGSVTREQMVAALAKKAERLHVVQPQMSLRDVWTLVKTTLEGKSGQRVKL